jgi:hypothetical protein
MLFPCSGACAISTALGIDLEGIWMECWEARKSGHGKSVYVWSAALLFVAAAASTARADESGLSFWLPGLQGSFAAVPTAPGWSFAHMGARLVKRFVQGSGGMRNSSLAASQSKV